MIPQTQKQYRLPPPAERKSVESLGEPKDAPVPKPSAHEVLVKIHAVSLNYRDILMAKNQYPGPPPSTGAVPVSDLAGEIVALGSDVKDWREGDRVCANCALAWYDGPGVVEEMMTDLGGSVDGVLQEYRVLPARSLVKIPEHLSYEEASTLPCAAVTAFNGLRGGPSTLKGGDWVLVQGTGGVSIFALQLAVSCGAAVIATSSSDDKLEIAKKLGAKHTINYKTTPEWGKKVLELTGGRGVDFVVEVGGAGTLQQSFEAVRRGGNIATIGFIAEPKDTPPLQMLCIFKAANFRGVNIGSVKLFEEMNRLIEVVALKPVVDKVFPFGQALDAYKHLESQKHVGKVVIKVAS